MLCASARKAFSNLNTRIIHISDLNTPQVEGSSDIFRVGDIDARKVMLMRMITYRDLLDKINEPVAFFDTDMLIIKRLHLLLKREI